MGAAEGSRRVFRPWQGPQAADAGRIGASGTAAGAEKPGGTDPPALGDRSRSRGPCRKRPPAEEKPPP